MTHQEIREKFLEFFEKRGHKIIPSSSLIPDDPSVLFTTAGMQQFKPYFTGEKNPIKDFGFQNTVSIQKCLRTSDIEEVGDESHLTFFEMLGNFSFDGYFKKDAIKFAVEFLRDEMRIDFDRITATYFSGDRQLRVGPDEISHRELKNYFKDEKKISAHGKKDNFWGPTGKEGPCGPTVEFYIDSIEIWNLVFNQYYCKSDKTLTPLDIQGVDTGMGLERLAMVLQNKKNIFETDLFAPLVAQIKSQISKVKTTTQNSKIDEDKSIRIIADHIKASVFLLADGIVPSNLAKGYILRRLIRRAVRHEKLLGFENNFILSIAEPIIEIYGNLYPELEKNKKNIFEELKKEIIKFEKGSKELLKIFDKVEFFTENEIETRDFSDYSRLGKKFFDIFSTYGFPIELSIEEINKLRKGLSWEKLSKSQEELIKQEFNEEFKKHQEISRAGAEKKFGGHGINDYRLSTTDCQVIKLHTATHLLQAALRQVLGKEVRQMGSDINEERLRFDFSFGRKMTKEEIKITEDLVNQKIKEKLEVKIEEMDYKEAIKSGVLAFFKEKYPERVKVRSIGNFSREVCGGPHVKNTSELSEFKIIKEESSSSGVRRIKAILNQEL